MRALRIHPNYHSGGAEIAGNWPPAWVAHLTGYLKAGGYTGVVFVDAGNKVDFAFADQRVHARPDAAAIAEADEAWVTMHGPKIEMRRKKGEELAAAAISACGGGTEQLSEEEEEAKVPG